MRKDNPACYECPKSSNKLHYWRSKYDTKQNLIGAICKYCKLQLNDEDAKEVFSG